MRIFLAVVFWVTAVHFSAVASEETSPAATPARRSFLSRVFHPFRQETAADRRKTRADSLSVEMTVKPLPLHLSDTRQIKLTIVLFNHSRRFVQLTFPTTQRIEVLVRDDAGKIVTQWSEDQSFENSADYIAINAGERLEYSASISTRDMAAGRKYTIESFFPNYPDLMARQALVPER